MEAAEGDWTAKLRAMGIKLAHPDDGWVNRERSRFSLSWYPQYDDKPEVGDLIAFGCPPWRGGEHYIPRYSEKSGIEYAGDGYRICRVTKVDRRTTILGRLEDFEYEDTGVRVPPPKPEPVSWLRRLFRRS